jgi:hypothetical protein
VVARDVEELTGHAWRATTELVDEGDARRPVLKRRVASLSVAPVSSVQRLEKRRLYSWRLSPGCCLQLRNSHCLLGHMYVPWKLPTKT